MNARAGLVRALSIACCAGTASLAGAPSSAGAQGVLLGVQPNATTARFLACMQGASRSAASAQPAGPAGAVAGGATPAAVAPLGPTVAGCVASIGYGPNDRMVTEATLCLAQKSPVIRAVCLNKVFDRPPVPDVTPVAVGALTPASSPSPSPSPALSPGRTPQPTPPPTHRPTPRATSVTGAGGAAFSPAPTPTSSATPTSPPPRATATPQSGARPIAILPRPTPAGSARPPGAAPPAGPAPTPSGPPAPVILGAVGLALVAAGLLGAAFYRRRRTPQREPQMHQLEILTPRDASIAVAGKPVTFTVRTEPPHLAAGVRWSVATQPGEPGAHGTGPAFTYTFGATGVEQVVAHLDQAGLTSDVVVYVFKTRTGGSALADVLRSEPPPVARSAGSLRRWGASTSAPRRAS